MTRDEVLDVLDTTVSLKRRKLAAESERIEFANAVARGEFFPREDVDAANMQLGTAFKLAIAEAKATWPPQLAGLDEVGIDKRLDETFRVMLTNLSDLESALWQEVSAKCAKMSGDPK